MSGNQYLFLFTIGPVQSFIAQARKTRDLYAGSSILGEIIGAAMKYAQDNYRAEIIIPDPRSDAKPNRFLAKVISDNPKKYAGEVEEAARAKWRAIALQSFRSAGVCHAPETNNFDEVQKRQIHCTKLEQIKPAETEKQIEDFLEFYWVMLELDDGHDYQEKHDQIQEYLAAIKNTRRFNQIDEPAARKCSLDGGCNALFYRKGANNGKPAFIQRKYEDKDGAEEINGEKKYLLNPGEALSAVSLVKRFYEKEDERNFPSTAEVALKHVLEKIHDSKKKEYKRVFGKDFDEQLYYEENLTEEYFKKHEFRGLINRLPAIREERKALFDGYKQSRYYALIAFDGDDMGRVWSGKFLKNGGDLKGFQIELAKRLGEFAKKAEGIVNTSNGKTVYAGGDDFLGFVNLNSLFDVMSELRESYDTIVSLPLKREYNIEDKLTFSAGVVIAHYKTPLSMVIHEAHAGEAKAKEKFEKYGKNAFAISVLKRSGESRKCQFTWTMKDVCLSDYLSYITTRLMDKRGFSSAFIKNIDNEIRPLIGSADDYEIDSLLKVELKRLIVRSSILGNSESITSGMIEAVLSVYKSNSAHDESFYNFVAALHICDFIKRKTDNE